MANISIDEAIYRLVLDFQEAFAASTADTVRLAGKKFEEVVDNYRDHAKNADRFATANRHLARLMQDAVIDAYKKRVLAYAPGSYRQGERSRLAGELLPALEDPDFAVGNAKGIGFINTQILDEKAKFWARLNYGAEPNIGNRVHAFQEPSARIQFGANQGISLRLTSPPRPGFSVPQNMPVGHFNPSGQFFPFAPSRGAAREGMTIVKSRPSIAGIGARHFLEEGLVALANNFKDVYHAEFEEASRQAAAGSKSVRVRGRA